MHFIQSAHSQSGAQQRGIPRLIIHWLLDFGDASYDGHGGCVRYFSAKYIRRLEREYGEIAVRPLVDYFRCYLVESSKDGTIITVGKRHDKRRVVRH
jgi:hypothetical protein